VKNLLVFARQKGGAFQNVPLKPIIDRCVLLIQHHAQMHSVQLQTTCAEDITLECDPNQIQQALVALTVNGIESIAMGKSGGLDGRLTVDTSRAQDGQSVIIRVADNGIGMNEDVKAHLFEPFFTTKSEGKGVGLGLSVVFGIVESHHGKIEVTSSVGGGATFTLTLPVKQPSDAERKAFEQSVGGVLT
jgi:signal transduction histidine kinase